MGELAISLGSVECNGDITPIELPRRGAGSQLDQAIKVFRLNVEEYPASWNVYDSLGEAYMKAGQTSLAIQNYEKSIELNPKNTNGAAILNNLKEQK